MRKGRVFGRTLRNTICSFHFWVGCLVTVLTCFLTLQFQANYRASAVFEFRMIHSKAQSFLMLIPGVYGAALLYYRDIKESNIKNVVSRISLHTYVRVQTLVCSIGAWLISVIGNLLFIIGYGTRYGWYDAEVDALMLNEIFKHLLPDHIFLYFLLSTMQYALLSVMIAQLAMVISVAIPQLAIIFTIPVGLYYFLAILLKHELFDTVYLFLGAIVFFQNGWMHLVFVVGLTVFVVLICEKASYLLWYRRLYYA